MASADVTFGASTSFAPGSTALGSSLASLAPPTPPAACHTSMSVPTFDVGFGVGAALLTQMQVSSLGSQGLPISLTSEQNVSPLHRIALEHVSPAASSGVGRKVGISDGMKVGTAVGPNDGDGDGGPDAAPTSRAQKRAARNSEGC